MHHAILRNISRVMVLILLFTWSGIPPDLAYAAKVNKPSKEDLKQAAIKLERLSDALEEAAKEIPRDTFDPKAIVEKVGKDPVALFEWVRDNTDIAPYRGSLRGPVGVLMDRTGNSLDLALLLNALLTLAGKDSRFVKGHLPKSYEVQLFDLANSARPAFPTPQKEERRRDFSDFAEELASSHSLNSDAMRRFLTALDLNGQWAAEQTMELTSQIVHSLLKAVRGSYAKQPVSSEHPKDNEAPVEHWWIQLKTSSGWLDLDPFFYGSQSIRGQTDTLSYYSLEEIPLENFHRVTIKIIIQKYEEGSFERKEVLQYSIKASDAFERRIAIHHIPFSFFEQSRIPVGAQTLEEIVRLAKEEKRWLPVLSVGREKIYKSGFSVAGAVIDDPGRQPTSGMGSSIRDVFGGLFRGGAETRTQKRGFLTAEWIEYEIYGGSSVSHTEQRSVFNLVEQLSRKPDDAESLELSEEAQLRRGLALLGETEVLVQASKYSEEFLAYLYTTRFLQALEVVRLVLTGREGRDPTSFQKLTSRIVPFSVPLYSFITGRWCSQVTGARIYLDRPNVITFSRRIKDVDRGVAQEIRELDVVYNEVSVLGSEGWDAFSVLLEQGVCDTVVEAIVLGMRAPSFHNAATQYVADTVHNREWTLLTRNNKSIETLGRVEKEVELQIRDDLSNGFLVICRTPDGGEDIPISWWRIDLNSGWTIGFNSNAKGGMVEYLIAIFNAGLTVYCIYQTMFDYRNLCTLITNILCVFGGAYGWKAAYYGLTIISMGLAATKSVKIATAIAAITGLTRKVVDDHVCP